jgi:glucokinase
MDRLLLGADLGGTKGLLGLFAKGAARPVLQLRYACADFDGFDGMLARFLGDAAQRLGGDAARPGAACIGLAGPVAGGRARMTNLPWTLEAAALRRRFGLGTVRLVNDFAAAAAGVDALDADGWQALQTGEPQSGAPRVVLGPGTGLGAAAMFPVGRRWRIAGGEGGHVGLAPRSEIEVELWRWLGRLHGGRVSAERVLCGPGLANLYRFLLERDGAPAGTDPLLRSADPAAAIATAGLAAHGDAAAPADGDRNVDREAHRSRGRGEAPDVATARRAAGALDVFASMLGAFAGDLALFLLPRGGVYLAGGVAPRILDARRRVRFLEGFLDKGRHAGLLAGLPVRLVTEPALGLLGAGALADGRASVLGQRRR